MTNLFLENSPAFEGWDKGIDVTISQVTDGRVLLPFACGLVKREFLKPSVKTLGYFRETFYTNSVA